MRHKFHYTQNIKSPKDDGRLNATKGKAVIHFHKTNTILPMLLVCNSGNLATVQWSKNDPNLFVCSGIPQLLVAKMQDYALTTWPQTHWYIC